MSNIDRRDFLKQTIVGLGTGVLANRLSMENCSAAADPKNADRLFKISLAQWSLHRTFRGQGGETKRDPLDFAAISKELGIDAIEYVNQFFMSA